MHKVNVKEKTNSDDKLILTDTYAPVLLITDTKIKQAEVPT
jgi:hypothetical protein